MDVRLAGSGPAAEAVAAALEDATGELGTAVDPVRVAPGRVGGADLAVVVGEAGGDALPAANGAARGTETTWVGVELGGVGGRAVAGVEAAVAGFAPGICFDCLRTRVAANDPETGDPRPGPADARLAGAVAGRAALALLAGDPTRVLSTTPDGARVGGVVELPHAERTVLPVPGCDCDPGRERGLSLAHEERSLDAALERMELALDDRVGAVRSVGEVESFPAPYYLATLSDTTGFSDGAAPDHAGGVDPDWNRAFVKALGEALERYGAAVYRTDAMRSAPPGAVDGAVHPDRFVRPADPPVGDEPIPWVPARDLSTGEAAYLPAEAARFPPPDRRYFDPVTTGLGLGSSTVEAVLSGLYEVIERDAAMLAWYSTFEPLELAVDDDRYAGLARRIRAEELSATAALLTVDVDVPVVGAAVHREGEWPRFAAAAAADVDPAAAAADALAEAVQNWTELRSMGPDGAAEEPTAIGRYAETPGAARRFFEGDGPVPAGSVGDDGAADLAGEAELDALVGAVGDAGLTPYAADLTPRDVAAAGFSVVRVAVPGAQPLFVDVDDPVFGDRARSVPADMGFEADLDGPPHPFP
jgi:ribosomal protein S12 methylthiotransferase accessory factor